MFLSLIKIALNLRLYKYDSKTLYNKVRLGYRLIIIRPNTNYKIIYVIVLRSIKRSQVMYTNSIKA
jgi:hypothetical protein